jgi:hypothetical protein
MEEIKDAGIFEDEAVFVDKDECVTKGFVFAAGSKEVLNVENEEVGILDSIQLSPREQNDAAEHARLPESLRSCPSFSSFVPLPKAMASSRFQLGKRMGFGAIVFASVFVATTRWRLDSCEKSTSQKIALNMGRGFVPYKHYTGVCADA